MRTYCKFRGIIVEHLGVVLDKDPGVVNTFILAVGEFPEPLSSFTYGTLLSSCLRQPEDSLSHQILERITERFENISEDSSLRFKIIIQEQIQEYLSELDFLIIELGKELT